MLYRVQPLAFSLIGVTIFGWAGLAAAQSVSPRCEAAVDHAAGRYNKCLLQAEAKFSRNENLSRLERRQDRCDRRFERRTNRAVARYGADECTSKQLISAIKDRSVSCVEGVANEAAGNPSPSRLYVQGSTAGALNGTTLVLTGVDPYTAWFTDRPYRDAGRITTEEFTRLFDEDSANAFSASLPNADFTCEFEGGIENYFVTLSDPIYDGHTLTYTVDHIPPVTDDAPFSTVTCDSDAHLFIDTTEAVATGEWHPKERYVMVTLDDGFTVGALRSAAALLFDGCEVNQYGQATDLPKCSGKTRRTNPDGSPFRMTYFATAGSSSAFANLDYWASLGNEVANHTVTHVVGWGGHDAVAGKPASETSYNGAYTKARWTTEMVDLVDILKFWTSITENQKVRGFRAPQLQLNYYVFEAMQEYISEVGTLAKQPHYDSDFRYDLRPADHQIQTPKLLSQENFCDGQGVVQPLYPVDWPYGNCEELIPENPAHPVWELPMPLFNGNLMELPTPLSVMNDFLAKQHVAPDVDGNGGGYRPLLISLHPDQLTTHPDFLTWVENVSASSPEKCDGTTCQQTNITCSTDADCVAVNFITVGEVIDMYANQTSAVEMPATYAIPQSCLDESVFAVGPRNCPSEYASSVDPSSTSGYEFHLPFCDLICQGGSYGDGCYNHDSTPALDNFTTCNETCSAKPSGGTIPSGYVPGAFPWLGNPVGNKTLAGSAGADACNHYPNVSTQ